MCFLSQVYALDVISKKPLPRDFLGGPVVKNLPLNTGDASWIPGQGTKIPYAVGLLSIHAAITEPIGHN